MKTGAPPIDRIILVAPPWPLFNRPSIQLGVLKGHLNQQLPGLQVETHPLYLKIAEAIGYPVYTAISSRTWLAEPVYAALLFPERISEISAVFRKAAAGSPILKRVDFAALTETIRQVSIGQIRAISWHRAGLAGFSVCFAQLTAALYLARSVKRLQPDLPVVFGGSIVSGNAPADLVTAFPQVDHVVCGEGEIPLARLARQRFTGTPALSGTPIRAPGEDRATGPCSGHEQVDDLDRLPMPDYTDYFSLLGALDETKRFFPVLPLEISRGCRWQTACRRRSVTGCAFCNLNLQWDGYRSKSPHRVVAEIRAMTSAYGTLSVAFTDNMLPVRNSEAIFDRIRRQGRDIRFFGEIRARTPKRLLAAMHRAGMAEVQIGIEALSTSLLKRLNKGTTAIGNIEIMKHCEEIGLVHRSNLILQFPGSRDEEVAETRHALAFLTPFQPLRPVNFWLGLGSPVWRDPRRYGLKAVFNHPNYRRLFPPDIARRVPFLIQSYRGDRRIQRKRWRAVRQELVRWEKSYRALRAEPFSEPILSYRDAGDFMVIRHRRLGAEPVVHRLTGTSRAIYRYCGRSRSFERIVKRFSNVDASAVAAFLAMMVEKRLMFTESRRYLSLAVRHRCRCS